MGSRWKISGPARPGRWPSGPPGRAASNSPATCPVTLSVSPEGLVQPVAHRAGQRFALASPGLHPGQQSVGPAKQGAGVLVPQPGLHTLQWVQVRSGVAPVPGCARGLSTRTPGAVQPVQGPTPHGLHAYPDHSPNPQRMEKEHINSLPAPCQMPSIADLPRNRLENAEGATPEGCSLTALWAFAVGGGGGIRTHVGLRPKRFSRPPRYDRFGTPPVCKCALISVDQTDGCKQVVQPFNQPLAGPACPRSSPAVRPVSV